jgi:hypothetical protein
MGSTRDLHRLFSRLLTQLDRVLVRLVQQPDAVPRLRTFLPDNPDLRLREAVTGAEAETGMCPRRTLNA